METNKKTEEEMIRERLTRGSGSEKKQEVVLFGARTREDGLVELYKYTKSVSMVGIDQATQGKLIHESPLYQAYLKNAMNEGPFTMEEVEKKAMLKTALEGAFPSKPIRPSAPLAKEKRKHLRQVSLMESHRPKV